MRVEKEEEKKQRNSKEQQQQLLESSQKKLTEMSLLLQELEREAAEPDLDSMLNKTDQEVKQLRQKIQEEVTLQLNQQKTKNIFLTKLQDGSTPAHALLAETEKEIRTLKEEYNQITDKINNIANEFVYFLFNTYKQLIFFVDLKKKRITKW